MATFRSKDRARRRGYRAYHASAMLTARIAYDFSDPSKGEESNIIDAWHTYVLAMNEQGQQSKSFDKFKKELKAE